MKHKQYNTNYNKTNNNVNLNETEHNVKDKGEVGVKFHDYGFGKHQQLQLGNLVEVLLHFKVYIYENMISSTGVCL